MQHKEIAKQLESMAHHFPEDSEQHAEKAVFKFDGLTVRCKPNSNAIRQVAKRYRIDKIRAFKFKKIDNRRSFNQTAFEDFCRDGELSNAAQYADLFNKPVYFSAGKPHFLLVKVSPVDGYDDFIVARYYDEEGKLAPWNVFHTPTGKSCSSSSKDKAGSLSAFKNIPAEKLQRAVKSFENECDFQQKAREGLKDD